MKILAILSVFAWVTALSATQAKAPAMWRVADADSEFWLFGTVHLLPPNVSWRSATFERAFAAADTVYLEIDPHARPKGGMQRLLLQLGHNGNFVTLSSLLDARDTERLARAAAKLGIPPSSLEPLRPWLASVRLSLTHIAARGYDPLSGVDTIIAEMAAAARKRLGYFETLAQQFRIFASLSPRAEKAFLMATIEQVESDPDGIDRLVRVWAAGDTKSFDRLLEESTGGELPEVREALFDARNRRWTKRIVEAMAGAGKALVAVGAGHLTGPKGIVALLRDEGFVVTRQ